MNGVRSIELGTRGRAAPHGRRLCAASPSLMGLTTLPGSSHCVPRPAGAGALALSSTRAAGPPDGGSASLSRHSDEIRVGYLDENRHP